MAGATKKVCSLDDAIECFDETMAAHPERDGLDALAMAAASRRRAYPVFYMGHLRVPGDPGTAPPEFALPEVDVPDTPAGRLAREIVAMLEPLDMLNPVRRAFSLGKGVGTLITCFDIPTNPEAQDTPAFTRALDDVLADDPPDPLISGLMPQMRERIALIKTHVPPSFKIALPDIQGPFNIAHAVVGEEALIAPLLAPEKFHAFMDRVTNLWLAARETLTEWIGREYACPGNELARITECSVNLISADMYCDHVLPYDRRIAERWGSLHIHPCSGPHVFDVTLENLPVAMTEAGFVDRATAGAIGVTEAINTIGDRPITLRIDQELPEGREEACIRKHFQLFPENPRLLFSYTGMHWRMKDRPAIREMHRRLDEYWAQEIAKPRNFRQAEQS